MPLSKEIYTKAKTYVADHLRPNAKKKKYSLFISTGTSNDTGTVTASNKQQNLFTLACLRTLIQDPVAFIDPEEREGAFRGLARTTRLNEFDQSGKDIDLGWGKESSNNLLYKLANDYYSDVTLIEKIDPKWSKAAFIGYAETDSKFISEVASRVILDDKHTYACITKQAFYNWHYESFINTTALKNVLKKENAADRSSVGWRDVPIGPNEPPAIFISRSGAPFNAGTPTFCVIYEGTKEDLKNPKEVMAKAFDYLFPLLGKRKYSNLSEQQKANVEKHILVKVFTHKNTPQSFSRFDILETGDKIKFCVGADYAQLVLGLDSGPPPKQSYYDFIEYGLSHLGQVNPRYHLIQKSLSATNQQGTDVVFDEQISTLADILTTKDAAVQNGPALFFDLEDPKKDWYVDLVDDLDQYEGVDKDNPEVVDAILKPQFSLSLKNTSETIKETYLPLMEQYKVQRSVDPRILTMDFDTTKVLEDIVFYYDQSFNLLAIAAADNVSTQNAPSQEEDRLQKNNIPFEFTVTGISVGTTPFFVPGPNAPLSILNKYYSILPLPPTDKDAGIINVGLDTKILLVTEYFVNALYDNYSKVLNTVEGDAKAVFPTQPVGGTNSIFIKEGNNIMLSENLPILIPHSELETKVAGANEVFATLLLKAANQFFILANEIILGDSKGGVYSFATKSLEVAGGIVDFFSEPKTFQDKDLVVADNVQVFLDRFYYPPLLIKPTVPKQKALEPPKKGKTLPKNAGAPTTKKGANETVVDLDDYNSANKLFTKQVFVIAAQSSDSPCLNQLADVVKTGNVNDVYAFLLTKFPWDQIVAKSLLANLRRISNLIDTEGSKDFAGQVNACLQDLNVDKILAAFANFKNSFKNLDNIVNASLPEIPKLGAAVPYIYILDFQKAARDALIAAIVEGVMASLSFLLGIMLKDLLSACEQDGSLQTMLFDSNQGSLGKDGRHAKTSLADSVSVAATTPIGDDEYGSKKVYVDLIALLKASRVENLENILNGLLNLFPFIKTTSNPQIVMEAFLDDLSSQISAFDTKSLLSGTASNTVINKIINFASTQSGPIKKVFNNKYNVALLYKRLKEFISLDLINKKIVEVTTIVPDPCFINLGNIGTENLELLKEFLGADAEGYIDGLVNDASGQINSACAKFADGLYKMSIEAPNLISDSSKKALQKIVDSSLESIIVTQEASKIKFIENSEQLIEQMKLIYSGVDKGLGTLYIVPGTEKPPAVKVQVPLYNVLMPSGQSNKSNFNDANWSSATSQQLLIKALNANFNASQKGVWDPKYDNFGVKTTLLGPPFINKHFFKFVVESFGTIDPITSGDIDEWLASLSANFGANLDQIFQHAEDIKQDSDKVFNDSINEGGKNTNVFVANLKAMNKIIKSVKEN